MSRIKEIVEELNKLPKGYISKKTIHGKTYFYLQRKENSEVISEYIKSNEVENYRKLLVRRNKLEKELNVLLKSGKKLPILSKKAKELTGSLMSEDKVVASFENGSLVDIDEKMCPLFILRTSNLEAFLKLRAIDSGRTNSRLLKKALGISNDDNNIISLYAHGATITDNYWFKTKGSKLKYKDISFDGDFYSDLALNGELVIYPKLPKLTPEITTPGTYEKCWKKIDNQWWLYKKGNENEIFSELFCSKLAELIGINTAKYERIGNYIRTLNFADKYNFEPMVSIASDDDSYDNVFSCLMKIDGVLAKQYILLIWFDTIINNVDRHNENCGLLRDKKNGKIISLAPNFDNNLALIARNEVLNLDVKKDGFVSYFVKFIKNNSKAKDMYSKLDLPLIDEKIIDKCNSKLNYKKDIKMISKFIINRYKYLISLK